MESDFSDDLGSNLSFLTLDKLQNFAGPQFSQLLNGNHKPPFLPSVEVRDK